MRTRPILSRLVLAVVVAALVSPAAVLAVDPPTPAYGGPLDGAQEVPPVASGASGEGTVVISADESTIWYVVEYADLSGAPAAAHIHAGAAGENGGVILPLDAGTNPMVGTLTAADFTPSGAITTFAEAIDALQTGGAYFNVHTGANPGGEIRGQVVAKGDALFATLAGAQEVPAVTTTASGWGWVVLSDDDSSITYFVGHDLAAAPAAAHIHLGAAGANGGVLFPLVASTSPMTGTLSAADLTPTGAVTDMAGAVAAIMAGDTYFNLHTAANPGGELRGQIGGLPAVTPTPPPTSTGESSDLVQVGSVDGLLIALMAGLFAVLLLARRPVDRRRA